MRPTLLLTRRSTRRISRPVEEDDALEDPAPNESDDGAQDLIRSIEKFLEPLAEPTDQAIHESSKQPIRIDGAAAIIPDPPEARSSLSATICDAVDGAIADLKAKIFDLEQREPFKYLERDRHEAELEERLDARMEAALAERDAEIQTLKVELACREGVEANLRLIDFQPYIGVDRRYR